MIELKKYWGKLNALGSALIKKWLQLTNRSKRTRQEIDTSEQYDLPENHAASNPGIEIPLQSLPTEPLQVFQIWRNVVTRLPDEYGIPNSETVATLLPMTADYYSNLFIHASPHPHLVVDEQIWMKIKAALPKDYKIPDQHLLK